MYLKAEKLVNKSENSFFLSLLNPAASRAYHRRHTARLLVCEVVWSFEAFLSVILILFEFYLSRTFDLVEF